MANYREDNLKKKSNQRKLPIVLASTSRYRKAQLRDAGLKFQSIPSHVDEKSFHRKHSGSKLSQTLAYEKALAVARNHPNCVVIGADQLVSMGRKTLGKPGSANKAAQMLKQMSNRTHYLHTSLCMIYNQKVLSETITARIRMRKLSVDEIRAYVKKDNPIHCAGAYMFEKSGLSLVSSLDVSDPSSLIGLPMISLFKILRLLEQKSSIDL